MERTKVAILGCCLSGEPFHRFPEAPFTVVTRRFGTSIASLMSPPLKPDIGVLPEMPNWLQKCIEGDFTKSSLSILTHDFDYLIIDFGEDTQDLYRIGDSYVVHSELVQTCGVLKQFGQGEVISRRAGATTTLWKTACTRFCQGPLAHIPQERVILHRVRLASAYRDKAGVHPFKSKYKLPCVVRVRTLLKRLARNNLCRRLFKPRILPRFTALSEHYRNQRFLALGDDINPVLADYQRHFQELMPRARTITVAESCCLADAGHRLGLSPFHFIEEYDRSFISQLEAIAFRSGNEASAGIGRQPSNLGPDPVEPNESHARSQGQSANGTSLDAAPSNSPPT